MLAKKLVSIIYLPVYSISHPLWLFSWINIAMYIILRMYQLICANFVIANWWAFEELKAAANVYDELITALLHILCLTYTKLKEVLHNN